MANHYLFSFVFLVDSLKDQIELTSFRKSGEFITKGCKELTDNNSEIEKESITEEDSTVIASESNDGAVTVKE